MIHLYLIRMQENLYVNYGLIWYEPILKLLLRRGIVKVFLKHACCTRNRKDLLWYVIL